MDYSRTSGIYDSCGLMMEEPNKNTRTWLWNIQVTNCLNEAVEEAVRTDSHVSKSEFIRDAVREKLKGMRLL